MVIDSSNNHIVNLEFLEYNNSVKVFVHVQVEEWSKTLKRNFINLLQRLGECYALVEHPQIVKFAELHGGRLIKEANSNGKYLYMIRFN